MKNKIEELIKETEGKFISGLPFERVNVLTGINEGLKGVLAMIEETPIITVSEHELLIKEVEKEKRSLLNKCNDTMIGLNEKIERHKKELSETHEQLTESKRELDQSEERNGDLQIELNDSEEENSCYVSDISDLEKEVEKGFILTEEFQNLRYQPVFEDLFRNIQYIPIDKLEEFVKTYSKA